MVCPSKGACRWEKKFIGNGCEAEGGIQDISQGSDFNNWRIMMPFEIEFGGGHEF